MTATFHVGDAIETMNKLPEKSVDLILTSPPFLALRSYLPADHPDKALEGGSQATPGAYIDWLIDVVEACDRVLAPHGSLVFELGDTYSGSGGGGGDYLEGGWREGQAQFAGSAASMKESNAAHWRQKNSNVAAWPLPKSLSLIPELFRLTLVYGFNPLTGRQTDRWRLRNVVRWVRPNPPVGALGDKFRPATSELMVFCKSAKRYFDLDAVREPHQRNADISGWVKQDTGSRRDDGLTYTAPPHPAGAPPLDWWNIPPGGYEGAHYAVFPPELCIKPIKAMCPERVCRQCGEPSRRIVNDRTGTNRQPALAAHIKERREANKLTIAEINGWFGFREIAKNWERTDEWGAAIPNAEVWPLLKERLGLSDEFDDMVNGGTLAEYVPHGDPTRQNAEDYAQARMGQNPSAQAMPKGRATKIPKDGGWTDCGHNDYRPGTVLDPFVGSGTTLMVATGHGRDAIGIDLDSRNFDLALERVGPFILERAET